MLREQVDPDRIVVETSGVALPFDTTLNFWREPVSAWIGDDMPTLDVPFWEVVMLITAVWLARLNFGQASEATEGAVSPAEILVTSEAAC